MLHELLLALSGHQSPLLSDSKGSMELLPLLSTSEHELLRSIARLGSLHVEVRTRATTICSTQKSAICRAVSTSIISTHLARFQEKILSVEQGILQEDAGYVGAYDIVPLSAIVGAFDGWDRILEWLKSITLFMQPDSCHDPNLYPCSAPKKSPPSGAEIIDLLRKEAQTGYLDIEQLSLNLIKTAESAWLRQVSVWILYGRLPTIGADDFFIQRISDEHLRGNLEVSTYGIIQDLCPGFVNRMTAKSISFIGKSINHIQRQAPNTVGSGMHLSNLQESSLLTNHLNLLSSLDHPISPAKLSRVIGSIRSSLSQNALQKLLPLSNLLQTLGVLRSFFLLERGEFAITLIAAADRTLSMKHRQHANGLREKDLTRLSGVMIKEGEVVSTLAQSWSALAALQSIDDDESDEELDLARELISLSIKKDIRRPHKPSFIMESSSPQENYDLLDIFDDVLLATPTVLSINVSSPLDLFLTPDDIIVYSKIHDYLISLRRIHLHLTDLWKLSTLRRDPPVLRAANQISQQNRLETFRSLRLQITERTKSMRKTWAMIGSAIFFLAEFSEFLQGEAIKSSWAEFEAWLIPSNSTLSKVSLASTEGVATSNSPTLMSRPVPSYSAENVPSLDQPCEIGVLHDPETLMVAHKRYLASLSHAILLDDVPFIKSLRNLMTKLDYVVALMGRLNAVQRTLDIDRAHDTKQTSSALTMEVEKLMLNLDEVRGNVNSDLQGLVGRLRDIDTERLSEGAHTPVAENSKNAPFVPYRGGKIDRLLMKLDFVGLNDVAISQRS